MSLDLGLNRIGNLGISALARSLTINVGVMWLHLDQLRNKDAMNDDVVLELAEALRFNPTLTHLNISSDALGDTVYNKFGEEGDYAMKEIIDYKVDNQPVLEELFMKVIDHDGAIVLSSMYRMKFSALKAYILGRGW
jgi:hypothetical protein